MAADEKETPPIEPAGNVFLDHSKSLRKQMTQKFATKAKFFNIFNVFSQRLADPVGKLDDEVGRHDDG